MKNKNFHFWMHAYKKKNLFSGARMPEKKFYSPKINK